MEILRDRPHPDSDVVADGEDAAVRAGLEALATQRAVIARADAAVLRHQAKLVEVALAQMARSSSRDAREREMPMRSLAAEVGCALHVHDLTAQRELSRAHALVTRFAATVDALAAARISRDHALAILDAGTCLDDDGVRAAWESVVLEHAAQQTPGRTAAYARQLAERVNPTGMTERFEAAHELRGVSVLDLDDGMALLQVRLPAALAHGIRDRVRRQAELIRDAAQAERARRSSAAAAAEEDVPVVDDARTIPQISADIVADTLLTAVPSVQPDAAPEGALAAIRAHVQIVVPVSTLLGTTDAGATLHGQVPIDPATARRLAGNAPGWDRVLCDPITGTTREVDRYTPSAEQRRFLRARDQHCRWFGCRQPAIRCQLDHNHEHHDGGPTSVANLAHFCVRHHTLKTESRWTVTQLPDGVLCFTSPVGQRITDPPPRRVVFTPDPDPPPF